MPDITAKKLGRKPKRIDPRTFKLSRYLLPNNLPNPPSCCDWSSADRGGFPMFLNDELGCCTITAAAHLIESWTSNAAHTIIIKDSDVLDAYMAIGGYDPSDPSTDNGCVMLDVLKFWRNTGIAGHKIQAFMGVDKTSPWEIQMATWLFGGLYVGFNLPNSVKDQEVRWDVLPDDGGEWGGHCIAQIGSNSDEKKDVSWSEIRLLTSAFFQKYCDECFAIISPDWISKTGLSPSGFDLVTLQQDLAKLYPT